METELTIARMQPDDWESVGHIYLQGIRTGNATFATNAPEWDAWDAAHLPFGRLVARSLRKEWQQIVGWAALAPYSHRQVYSGVAEVSVYVAEQARGCGIGKALLSSLVQESRANGIWTLQAGIFPENTASIELHKHLGFRIVGVRERLGWMNGEWRDVVLMELRAP